LNKTFAGMARNISVENIVEQIEASLLLMPSYRRFPNSEEFKQYFKERNMYSFRNRNYWLRKLENFEREKEPVNIVEYTIEHVMPQNENLCKEWRDALGENWKEIQSRLLHTAGNLTLTGYNSEYSARPFVEKRDMENGFKDSPIRLNGYLRKVDGWNEATIMDRAEQLADMAVKVWAMPELSADILDKYRPAKSETTGYSINDHSHLLKEPLKSLFDKLSQEIRALDPCVRCEFMKQYVAYKAETNFADVVGSTSKELQIVLNMPFELVIDPKGICEDVSQKGKWGNGDVRFRLTSSDGLPYAVGLIRQALDRQLETTDTLF
jgi:predicted transport protein